MAPLGNLRMLIICDAFRYTNGSIIFAYSWSIGIGDCNRDEALALLNGLSFAKDLSIHCIVVEGDSCNAITWGTRTKKDW